MKKNINKQVGLQIKAVRKQKNLTQEDLSAKLFFSASVLSRIENGEVELMLSRCALIADALDVSIATLLGCGNASNSSTCETLTDEVISELIKRLSNN